MSKVVKIISFKETALFRRGAYLSAAALVLCVTAPALIDGGRASGFSALTAGGLMLVLSAFVLHRTRVHRVADEVMDCGDHLKVRRGRTEVTVPIADIDAVEVVGVGGFHRITVRLVAGRSAATIDFLPQASLWSNRGALDALAKDLTARARQLNSRDSSN